MSQNSEIERMIDGFMSMDHLAFEICVIMIALCVIVTLASMMSDD